VRIVHTSDWHLGKRLYEASLLEEQAHALEQVFEVCRGERADALIVAGDLYDRAVPPVDAVRVLDELLARVAHDLAIPVILISGNHDSADRLGFAAGVLERGGVHLRTSFARRAVPVVVERGRRRLHVYCLPYLEPEVARAGLGDEAIADHDGAVRGALAAIERDRGERGAAEAILVGHLFAAGGRESPESERPLVVGGAAQVGAATLAAGRWSYVALGHLHEAQPVGDRPDIRYSGSPCKHSFGEAEQEKSVTVVDVVMGRAAVRVVPLSPRRDLVRLEGRFEELLASPRFAGAERAYVHATYTDERPIAEPAARLRVRYPHLLQALPQRVAAPEPGARRQVAAVAAAGARGLLAEFWTLVESEPPSPDTVDVLEAALHRARDEQAKEPCALAS
jgi:exonuclease SbcD